MRTTKYTQSYVRRGSVVLFLSALPLIVSCGGPQSSPPILVTTAPSPNTENAIKAQRVQDELTELRRAAAGGDASAMYRLGNMAAQQGANADAVRWFRSASERGHVKANNALGFMYEEGRGVPQSFAQAGTYYLQAMKKGNADAMVNRGLLYAKGLGVTKDRVKAYMHFILAVANAQDQETREATIGPRSGDGSQLRTKGNKAVGGTSETIRLFS